MANLGMAIVSGGDTGQEVFAALGTTAGTATALTLAAPGFSLSDGVMAKIKLHVAISGTPTLSVNGTTATQIRGMNLAEIGSVPLGTWMILIYNGTYWVATTPTSHAISNTSFGQTQREYR